MMRTRNKGRIEVWSHRYINYPNEREGKDVRAVIVQIEPGNKEGQYIVEVIDSDD